jgi:hypothetical protein
MTAVAVRQLVYSNVEAEHSPSNRRGFQVWLASPGLRDRQREIARRLEDYDWPTADASLNRITERLTFFHTSAGDAVLARTVPLTERDALNRAGRFHAHALVLSPEEFAKVGCNPFSLFDTFRFQDDPTPVIESGSWRRDDPFGAEPLAVGPPARPDDDLARSAARMLAVLVRWLDGPEDPRPVALPVRPERVAGLLRALFRLLPPELRRRATFDTLSTGQSLGTLPYRFAGGYDLPTVRDWPYRRAYRLDLESGEFAPPLPATADATLDTLSAAWAADRDLSDVERDGSYRLAVAVREQSSVRIPPALSDRAVELVRSSPDWKSAGERLLHDRLAADLPGPAVRKLVEPAAVEWVGPVGPAALERLRSPVPVATLTGWLRDVADRRPLTTEQAAELEAWTAGRLADPPDAETRHRLGELLLIARRWGEDAPARVRDLLAEPEWSAFAAGWFPGWFSTSSPTARALTDPARAAALIDELFTPTPEDARAVDDAELLLAVSVTAIPLAWVKPLRFVVALHRGDQNRMEDLLEQTTDRATFLGWVYHHVVRYGWRAEYVLGTADGGQHPGVVLRPASGERARGVALLAAVTEEAWCRRQLFDWQVHVPPPGLAEVTAEDRPVAAALRAYQAERWDRFRDLLGSLTPAQFGWVANATLADKVLIHRHSVPVEGGVWIGLVPVSNGVHGPLFAGAYGAVIAAIKTNPARAALLTHATAYALNRR